MTTETIEFLQSKQEFANVKNEIDSLIKSNEKLQELAVNNFSANLHELEYLSKAPKNMWVDYLSFRHTFRNLALKKEVTPFPLYLLIEPTSICNLRCIMCFQTDKSFGGEKSFMGRMGLDLFKNIIDQAYEGGTKAITLASRGDPTLNKNLSSMLEYTKGKFLEVKLNTNGILLNDELSRSILSNEVTDLVFSIDSYEKENYEEIRKKAKFDKVVANIKRFMKIREEEFPDHRTTVRVSGVKVDEKQNKNAFNEFWARLVDYNVLVDMQERWDTYNNSPLPSEMLLPCGDLFERMYVWWDGKVNPCDVDYKSTLEVGDVNKQSIKEIWNGTKYSALRKKHLQGLRREYSVCAKCDAWTCAK